MGDYYYHLYDIETFKNLEGAVVILSENVTENRKMVDYGPKSAVISYGTFLSAVGSFLDIILLVAIVRMVKHYPGTNRALLGLLCCFQLMALLLVVPFEIAREYLGEWYLGSVACKLWTLAGHMSVPAILYTCTAMCVDRICHIRRLETYISRNKSCKAPSLLVAIVMMCAISVAPLICWMLTKDFILEEVCAVVVDIIYTPVLTSMCYFVPACSCAISLIILSSVTKRKMKQLIDMDRQESVAVLEQKDQKGRLQTRCRPVQHSADYVATIHNSWCTVTTLSVVCIVAWAPFYIANIRIPFCDGFCLDPRLWALFQWIGYSSYLLCPPLFLVDSRLRLTIKSWIKDISVYEESVYSRASTTSDCSAKSG